MNKSSDFTTSSTEIQGNAHRRGKIIFLHLDSADQVGHTFKPESKEYVQLLKSVDLSVSRIVNAINAKAQGSDARFAYIFTSDHGMTAWG